MDEMGYGAGGTSSPLSAAQKAPTPAPRLDPVPAAVSTEPAVAAIGDMDTDDLRAELLALRYARQDEGQLSPVQEQRFSELTRENEARWAKQAAEVRRADDARSEQLHQDWLREHGPETPEQARVRQVVADLMANESDLVDLNEVRARVPELSREAFDRAVRDLEDDPDVWLVPQTDQATLTAAQIASAVRIGGKDKHRIRVRTTTAPRTSGED